MKFTRSFIVALSLLYIAGCTPDSPPYIQPQPIETPEVNNNIATNVINVQFKEVDEKIQSLYQAVSNFTTQRTQATLDTARGRWRESHEWWCESQAMAMGPSQDKQLSAQIDSFPVVVADLEQIIKTTPIINEDIIQGFSGSLKGFHALEYLLFGYSGTKQISEFTPKEFEYISALAREMERQARSVRYAWDPTKGNYVGQITDPGQPGGSYATDKDALRDILNAMIFICDDLAERKIGKPYEMNLDSLEESRFSANSTNDYRSNVLGVLYLYQGGKQANSYGISGLVISKSGLDLDSKVFLELSNAENAISALVKTFASSLKANPDAVANARAAVRTLKVTLETQVKPVLLQ
jgi:predicted lipoprotein